MSNIQRLDFGSKLTDEISKNKWANTYWPMVYILSCPIKKQAYIGETADASRRLASHQQHPSKKKLKTAHLIGDNKFHKSITLDLESQLIKYVAADGQFKILNANIGITNHNYPGKKDFGNKDFQNIWEKLRKAGIVSNSLKFINNSDLFKYSPYKSLSDDQYRSLSVILQNLVTPGIKTNLVIGGAGTGKSILAIFLIKLLCTPADDINLADFLRVEPELYMLIGKVKEKYPNPRVALVIPMASFRGTLQKVFSKINGLQGNMVVGPTALTRENYDIVLIDEAHRLRRRKNLGSYFDNFNEACKRVNMNPSKVTELSWATKLTGQQILFYDKKQSIRTSDVKESDFDKLRKKRSTITTALTSQLRTRGGKGYSDFIDRLFYKTDKRYDKYCKCSHYELLLFDSLTALRKEIIKRDNDTGLSRLVAGIAWPWNSKKNPRQYDITIEGEKLRWNTTQSDWINSKNAIREVGCIHTVQGYDLNYTGVIFGNDIGFDAQKRRIFVRKDEYKDKAGKADTSDAQLHDFILNIYATLMQRGISGTFVYVCDPELRKYFARRIPAYKP